MQQDSVDVTARQLLNFRSYGPNYFYYYFPFLSSLYKLSHYFKTKIQKSEYIDKELININRARIELELNSTSVKQILKKQILSSKEMELLVINN